MCERGKSRGSKPRIQKKREGMSGSRGRWRRLGNKIKWVRHKKTWLEKIEVQRSDISLSALFFYIYINNQDNPLFHCATEGSFQHFLHFHFIYNLLPFYFFIFYFKPLTIILQDGVLSMQSCSKLVSVILTGLIYIYIIF